MGELAALIEVSAVARLLRGGVWLYPLVSVLHVVGVALLLGGIAVLDLRLLGRGQVALEALADLALPVAVSGLVLAFLTGPLLFSIEARDYLANPFFLAKLGAVALALLNVLLLHRTAAWREAKAGRRLRWGGLASLGLWLLAVTLGRLIAYW